ncbi:MAG: lmo0937 family membrane protein [Pyrinomonadaceae bacterium]
MLETVIIVLLILWLLGLVNGIAGNFIHLVLIAALLIFAFRFFSSRRAI